MIEPLYRLIYGCEKDRSVRTLRTWDEVLLIIRWRHEHGWTLPMKVEEVDHDRAP